MARGKHKRRAERRRAAEAAEAQAARGQLLAAERAKRERAQVELAQTEGLMSEVRELEAAVTAKYAPTYTELLDYLRQLNERLASLRQEFDEEEVLREIRRRGGGVHGVERAMSELGAHGTALYGVHGTVNDARAVRAIQRARGLR